jgi:hypothetical protein
MQHTWRRGHHHNQTFAHSLLQHPSHLASLMRYLFLPLPRTPISIYENLLVDSLLDVPGSKRRTLQHASARSLRPRATILGDKERVAYTSSHLIFLHKQRRTPWPPNVVTVETQHVWQPHQSLVLVLPQMSDVDTTSPGQQGRNVEGPKIRCQTQRKCASVALIFKKQASKWYPNATRVTSPKLSLVTNIRSGHHVTWQAWPETKIRCQTQCAKCASVALIVFQKQVWKPDPNAFADCA